ncbi:MAG TPA: peptidoglycan DD-metalloendopeptidase family protein [Gemmatimonadales bacterium]|nr:peptidoglycan DD-metalloendopeptidase family protein [Gemmatimonadales bacterium]
MAGRAGASPALVAAALAALMAGRLAAQQPAPADTALENSQQRLVEIRRERQRLQGEMERLRGQVHSLSSEVQNLREQVRTTGRIVSELDLQIAAMGSQIGRKTADLLIAQDALAEKRAILHHRLIEIAKRGPLYEAQVLLAAESFGDLASRYKYLYLISRQDRQLVADVEALRDSAASGRNVLLNLQGALSRRRDERAEENQRYRQLEQQSQRSLRQSQQDSVRTRQQLAQLAKDEARLNDIIAGFERRRLEAANRGAPAAPSRLRTADFGQLDWPVTGDIIYRFGRQSLPNGTTIRRDGIGIAVPPGTPVHAIADGIVRSTRSLGTYGPSIVVEHGGGFYSVYLYLSEIDVKDGQAVTRGQVIGRSGGENSDERAHIEFQIRGEAAGQSGQAKALDPVNWLRRRR